MLDEITTEDDLLAQLFISKVSQAVRKVRDEGDQIDIKRTVEAVARDLMNMLPSSQLFDDFYWRPEQTANLAWDYLIYRMDHKGLPGFDTGFPTLNEMLGGFEKQNIYVFNSSPGSGKCLSGTTMIDDPTTGQRLTIQEYVEQRVPSVVSMDMASYNIKESKITHWTKSGIQECYELTTKTGRRIEATASHPLLTIEGWKPLEALRCGDQVVVPSEIPVFGKTSVDPGLARLLGYMIGDGGLSQGSPRFTNIDPIIIADFKNQISTHFPECRVVQYGIGYAVFYQKGRKNPFTSWLQTFDLMGKRSTEKHIPTQVWQWDRESLTQFILGLFSCDGSIYAKNGRYPCIEFTVAAERLAQDVQHALLRFGIISTFRQKTNNSWLVAIYNGKSVEKYQREIGWYGEKSNRCIGYTGSDFSYTGNIPRQVWALIQKECQTQELALSEVVEKSKRHLERKVSPLVVRQINEVLQNTKLGCYSNPSIYWDEIVSIRLVGDRETFDLTVPDNENFVAGDIIVHNSTIMLQMAYHIANQTPVIYFTPEARAKDLSVRLLSAQSGVPTPVLRRGDVERGTPAFERLERAKIKIAKQPLIIYDMPEVSVDEINRVIDRTERERGHKVECVFMDYLQQMSGEDSFQDITNNMKSLETMTVKRDVATVMASQVGRASGDGGSLSSGKGSGKIEELATAVLGFIIPEQKVFEDQYRRILVCSKNRHEGVHFALNMKYDPTNGWLSEDGIVQ